MSSKFSSLFRSKSETPSPRRSSRPFSRILSPARSAKLEEGPSSPKGASPLDTPTKATPNYSTDPYSSPTSQFRSAFDAPEPPGPPQNPPPSREQDDFQSSEVGLAGNGDPDVYTDTSEMDEQHMRRQLMDMESSFLPDLPPSDHGRQARSAGLHHSPSNPTRPDPVRSASFGEDFSSHPDARTDARRLATPAEDYKTPATGYSTRVDTVLEVDEIEDLEPEEFAPRSSVGHSLSSPSAAAAQRSRLRAAATEYSPLRNATTLALVSPEVSDSHRERLSNDEEGTESFSEPPPVEKPEVVEPPSIERADPGGEPDDKTTQHIEEHRSSLEPPRLQSDHRPSLTNRQSSQRSSASSYLSNEAGSETAGFDSGGATPGSFSTVRPGHELTRLPSLGSVASATSIGTDRSASYRRKGPASGTHDMSQENSLATVTEDRAKTMSPPETPHAGGQEFLHPRDTIIAQHVRDVEVPATVARKYKAAQPTEANTRPSNFVSPSFGRAKNDLTLKEQNSRIDKLSKENFDLKLKIHYLYQALQDRSDEGVKDLISKNAQLSTDIIKIRKENQSLRKRVKQFEREMRSRDDGVSAARTVSESEDIASSRSWQQAQLEEEISYLRDRMQAIEEDNARLRRGGTSRDNGKQRMTDQGKADTVDDDAALLKEELQREKSKRQHAEHDAVQLRQELSRVRNDRSPVRGLRLQPPGHNVSAARRSLPQSSEHSPERGSLSGSTVVDQLKQENSDLRRDLGAQTSMLTSRNRERERLQQEIEDLKLLQRRGDGSQSQTLSVSGDSVLDRSVSRNQFRPSSRTSAKTDQMSENEKDRYETKQAALRDENATLRMRIGDLQGELDMLTGSAEHLENLRNERDEALILIEEERDFAADTIDRLEEQIEQKDRDIDQLFSELRTKEDESLSLEKEIREISASLSEVADASENSHSTIQNLRDDLAAANGELEAAQYNLKDAVAAKERLEVQAESSQGEIAFLREEQEADKIKISDLQSALTRAKMNLRDEKERLKEFEAMEAETRKARDEARRIRKALSAKDEELAAHRESLDDLEDGLRQAIGSSEQNRPALLKRTSQMRQDLDQTRTDLEQIQGSLEEKHQRLQDHIMLLESSEAERNRVSNMLEQERQIRQQHQKELERARSHPASSNRLLELERLHQNDQHRLMSFQQSYEEQLSERTKQLYDHWVRLVTVCGSGWLENFKNSVNPQVPTLESVSQDPKSVDTPFSMAIDNLSQTLSSFRTRIRSTEKDLSKDLEVLSSDLDHRSKRIDKLEQSLTNQGVNSTGFPEPASADIDRLKDENKLLRRELKVLKQGAFALPGLPSPQHELDTAAHEAALIERQREGLGPAASGGHSRRHHRGPSEDDAAALQRHHSTAGIISAESTNTELSSSSTVPVANGHHPSLAPSEQRWILRLKELERRLKAEREGRLLDRSGARKRLEERDNQIGGLKKELEMEKERKALIQSRQANSITNSY